MHYILKTSLFITDVRIVFLCPFISQVSPDCCVHCNPLFIIDTLIHKARVPHPRRLFFSFLTAVYYDRESLSELLAEQAVDYWINTAIS